jgi:hypothetical protein
MPAEIRQVKTQRQARLQEVLPFGNFIGLVVNVYRRHNQSRRELRE